MSRLRFRKKELRPARPGQPAAKDQLNLHVPVDVETAIACCLMLAAEAGVSVNVEAVRNRHLAGQTSVPLADWVALGSDFGWQFQPKSLTWAELIEAKFSGPVLLVLKNSNMVLARGADIRGHKVAVADPLFEQGKVLFLTREQLESSWDGAALITKPHVRENVATNNFGFSWFLSKLQPGKRLVRDIILAAMGMHLLTLAVPLFFQAILDKVLPNRAMTTLATITIGISLLLVFDALFNYLRNTLLAHLNRRFEQSISNELVEHLLSLPIDFFNRNPSGVLVHRVNEANNVKDFLASRLFNTLLDMTAVVIFLPLLAFYSLALMAIVLVITVCAFAVLFFAARRFNKQVRDLNAVEGRRKGYLVELVHGISTVKSLAIETFCMRRWKRLSAEYAEHGLHIGQTSAMARAIISGFERSVPIFIGAVGVLLVIQNHMTVGALIAFNMLGTRVSSPLIQCAGLLQDYQKALLSLFLVGELMRTKPEEHIGELTSPLLGEVEFDSVNFTYPHSSKPTLRSISLKFNAGQTIGIVGRSGSGKTTITRLLQKLYTAESGIIRLDGHDIREIETNHLRKSIGVVQQDNYFFRGSVRENIALGHPEATMEDVVRAAQLAGAHEFIQLMPQGYSSPLDENAQNLSGGQRQRLAIARTLLRKPKLMIFDEATSSLDPESEAIVRDSLNKIARGRTTIIITHRLSFVRHADQIVVIDQGEVVDVGTHDFLIRRCALYREFWNQQARVMA